MGLYLVSMVSLLCVAFSLFCSLVQDLRDIYCEYSKETPLAEVPPSARVASSAAPVPAPPTSTASIPATSVEENLDLEALYDQALRDGVSFPRMRLLKINILRDEVRRNLGQATVAAARERQLRLQKKRHDDEMKKARAKRRAEEAFLKSSVDTFSSRRGLAFVEEGE